mmetsp:Transcript_38073/g.28053  ORF Transcript_38073/g.28053 Transcript_38073/m.28053 type:complete len:82 (-) Transcript_38073:996-1241(-)|eukprot:CAMPEP_0202959626 /NCGR_PEP_ID=MMETSP1396-20130829/3809_1 /ASSEMBLY_ACC=CAM_ASM_000872 /TAXON_ID= /ORGANISM="Pseudokeronopsis sp., Strain Brazil" /LENGTH=81 /DNA_ID=CAMNT_0049678295 /DNA_START=180 /DNA_END=425 /DNA_ORIENTATION=+
MSVSMYEKEMYDYFDVQLFSTVHMGTSAVPFNLIYDTGSSWLWVALKECFDCPLTKLYNYTSSADFRVISDVPVPMLYGSG